MVCSSSLLSLREDSEAPKGGLFTLLLPTAHSCLFYGASIFVCVDCRLAGIPVPAQLAQSNCTLSRESSESGPCAVLALFLFLPVAEYLARTSL